MLSDLTFPTLLERLPTSLNAPSGAGCFLTCARDGYTGTKTCRLNAPSGAGCFLTENERDFTQDAGIVLMHLLVLGAF